MPSSLAWPDRFFPFFFAPPQRKTDKSGLASLTKRLLILSLYKMANQSSLLLETQKQDISNTRCVPIVELSKESADHAWPAVVEAIRGASYVALDLVSCRCYSIISCHRQYIIVRRNYL